MAKPTCKPCKRTFISVSRLEAHNEWKHGEIKPEGDPWTKIRKSELDKLRKLANVQS